jgi:hypothetical protein
VRLRTDKGCLSRATALALVFKLAESAERHWRRLNGSDRLAEIIRGVRFATVSRSPLPRTRRCLTSSPKIDHSPRNPAVGGLLPIKMLATLREREAP